MTIVKKDFYYNEFSKYKNDIRKTWDTLKEVINKKTFKSDFPSNFLLDGAEKTGSKNIADKFNEYFTEIGPILARSIDTVNKTPFDSYITTPCAASFNFTYILPHDIVKIIRNLRPKSNAGDDNISTKLLKEIEHVISRPLSIIINESLCTGIFPDKLKIAKVIPLYKTDDINHLGITVRYHYFPPYFRTGGLNQLYNYFTQVESVSKLTKITSLSHLYHVIVLYKEGYHYDACVRMSSREVKSQSSASFYSHPVFRKYYSMDKLGVSSIDDFDMQSVIFHENKTMNRLSDTSNTNCFYDTLETNVGVGNESDDKHDTSDITDEYAVDYLHYAQKYRLNNPRNCIIGHLNINSIRNKFDAVECV